MARPNRPADLSGLPACATDDSAAAATNPRGLCELITQQQHLDRVVRQGILTAKTSLDIMTADFKAMLVPPEANAANTQKSRGRRSAPSIVTHLLKLAKAGVEIRLLHAGVPSAAALRELKKASPLPATFTVRRCPRLHTKAVLVDAAALYVGSANLTGAGLGAKAPQNRNFEIGLWTTAPDLIEAVSDEFNTLWEGQPCATCGRRDVCPVPLEEPDL